MNIEFRSIDMVKEEYEVLVDNVLAGIFRFYENPDFSYGDIQLTRFLGYVNIDKRFRQRGIFRKIVEDFDIKSLMVDDVDDIPTDILIRIYNRLGFRLIEGSKQFMIRK